MLGMHAQVIERYAYYYDVMLLPYTYKKQGNVIINMIIWFAEVNIQLLKTNNSEYSFYLYTSRFLWLTT